MKNQFIINLIIVLIALSPIGYLFLIWNTIPESFVVKFEFNEALEKVQSRKSLMWATIGLSVVAAIFYLLMRNLRKVDPKVNDTTPKSSFHKLGLIITIFLVVINYYFLLSAKNELTISSNTAFALLGLLVALIGNYMNNIKPNYIAGIRLPWTLNDHDNWRKTHQLAGKLWFAGGVLLMIISLLISKSFLMLFMITLLVVLVLIPSIYSYKIYRNKLNQL